MLFCGTIETGFCLDSYEFLPIIMVFNLYGFSDISETKIRKDKGD